MHNQERQ